MEFGILRVSWNQFPMDTEGQLYNNLVIFSNSHFSLHFKGFSSFGLLVVAWKTILKEHWVTSTDFLNKTSLCSLYFWNFLTKTENEKTTDQTISSKIQIWSYIATGNISRSSMPLLLSLFICPLSTWHMHSCPLE